MSTSRHSSLGCQAFATLLCLGCGKTALVDDDAGPHRATGLIEILPPGGETGEPALLPDARAVRRRVVELVGVTRIGRAAGKPVSDVEASHWLAANLQIEKRDLAQVFEIRVSAIEPDAGLMCCDACVQALLELALAQELGPIIHEQQMLEERLRRLAKDLGAEGGARSPMNVDSAGETPEPVSERYRKTLERLADLDAARAALGPRARIVEPCRIVNGQDQAR